MADDLLDPTIKFTVKGEPASKSNSRRLVFLGDNLRPIKSKKALDYIKTFKTQCPKLSSLIEDDVRVRIKIWYATRRPDLDESVILDAMQGLIYKNDRQVKEKLIIWGLDKVDPRADITVQPLQL